MRGGWTATFLGLAVVASISGWEAWRGSHRNALRDRAREVACNGALADTATRHEMHAANLDQFGAQEKAMRLALEKERAVAVSAVEALSLRGVDQSLLGSLRKRLDGKPGIDKIEVTRRADEQLTVGWQEYAIRLRGGWEAVTAAIDAVHDLPVVVRVDRMELRLDRTRRRATLDARVVAAVWSDPRIVERAHPELAEVPTGALLASACHPLDVCRSASPEPDALARWEHACALIDERAPLAQSFRLSESEREEVRRLQALAIDIAGVRVTSRVTIETRGAELLDRAEASKRGYAGVDLSGETGPVWLD